MIISTRYRHLPDEQMQHLVDYFEAGKPIIGMRTATHAFLGNKGKFAKYNDNANEPGYEGGFGRQVLGEKWISHHGLHGKQSTRGILNKEQAEHPILRGFKDGDIWGPTDVYGANPLKPSTVLVHGQVLTGMSANDNPLPGKKNDPMMPISWTAYKGGRVFTTTMGASQDLEASARAHARERGILVRGMTSRSRQRCSWILWASINRRDLGPSTERRTARAVEDQ